MTVKYMPQVGKAFTLGFAGPKPLRPFFPTDKTGLPMDGYAAHARKLKVRGSN